MFRGRNRESQSVTNSLMKSGVGARSEADWLMSILLIILNMAHFVMNRDKVILIFDSTLFDSVIASGSIV